MTGRWEPVIIGAASWPNPDALYDLDVLDTIQDETYGASWDYRRLIRAERQVRRWREVTL